MKTKLNFAAAAAILATVAVPDVASAQLPVFYPPAYSWSQADTPNVFNGAQGSVGAGENHREPHAPRPYGQW